MALRQLSQHRVGHLEQLCGVLGRDIRGARCSREERHLPEECALLQRGELQRLAVREVLPDPHLAFHDDEEAAARLALLQDLLAGAVPAVGEPVHQLHEGVARQIVEQRDPRRHLPRRRLRVWQDGAERGLQISSASRDLRLLGSIGGDGEQLDLLLRVGAEQIGDRPGGLCGRGDHLVVVGARGQVLGPRLEDGVVGQLLDFRRWLRVAGREALRRIVQLEAVRVAVRRRHLDPVRHGAALRTSRGGRRRRDPADRGSLRAGKPRALQRGLAEAALVHPGELLLRLRIARVDLEDDFDRGDRLDEMAQIRVGAPCRVVLGDRLLRQVQPPVAIAQPEPVLHVLRLRLHELLQDFRGLLELRFFYIFGGGILERARICGILGHLLTSACRAGQAGRGRGAGRAAPPDGAGTAVPSSPPARAARTALRG